MLRNIVAGIAGVLIAAGLVMVVQMIGHSIYPLPPDLDVSDLAAMRAYVAGLPFGALFFVVLAWGIGSFGGTLAAVKIGTANPVIYACVVGGFVLAGTTFSLATIPHPLWVGIVGVALIVAGAWLGMQSSGQRADSE